MGMRRTKRRRMLRMRMMMKKRRRSYKEKAKSNKPVGPYKAVRYLT